MLVGTKSAQGGGLFLVSQKRWLILQATVAASKGSFWGPERPDVTKEICLWDRPDRYMMRYVDMADLRIVEMRRR